MLLGTLDASLLENILSGRGMNKKRQGIKTAGEGMVKAGYGHHSLKSSKNNMNFQSSLIL